LIIICRKISTAHSIDVFIFLAISPKPFHFELFMKWQKNMHSKQINMKRKTTTILMVSKFLPCCATFGIQFCAGASY